jgi:hypothetical protein
MFVFCQAGRYQQLALVDESGVVISKDVPKVLGTIKCGVGLQGKPLPTGYNAAVMKASTGPGGRVHITRNSRITAV